MNSCQMHFKKNESLDYSGGRIEKRTDYVTTNLEYIDELSN